LAHINYQTKDKSQLPEGGILKTRAIYNDKILADYRGNPLIEALPPELSSSEMTSMLEHLPAFNPRDREASAADRLDMTRRLLRLFIALPQHRSLARTIHGAMRDGYSGRNPATPGFYRYSRKRVITMMQNMGLKLDPSLSGFGLSDDEETVVRTAEELFTSTHGFHFIGLSGMGKSTALRKILSRYPQVLLHDVYKGNPCSFQQVTWLHLECPSDGRLNGLCERFFQALDEILGSSYYSWAVRNGRQMPQHLMIPVMAHLAQLHGLGLLVIDEVQRLSESRSGGHLQMLNFFTELQNTIHVPIVLVGTPTATDVLNDKFRLTRRGCSQGEVLWNRMKEDRSWHEFLDALWQYQYTSKVSPLGLDWGLKDATGRKLPPVPSRLSHVIYDETQGIVHLVVILYMLAQARAIRSGREVVDESTIKSVAFDSFGSAQKAIRALREGNKKALAEIGDLSFDGLAMHANEKRRKAA